MGEVRSLHRHFLGSQHDGLRSAAGAVPALCQRGGFTCVRHLRQFHRNHVHAFPGLAGADCPLGVVWPVVAGQDGVGSGHQVHAIFLALGGTFGWGIGFDVGWGVFTC